MLADLVPPAAAPTYSEPSWSAVGKQITVDLVRSIFGNVGGKVASTFNPAPTVDPARLAAEQAAREAEEKKRVLLIVGGVAGALLLGALVMRKSS